MHISWSERVCAGLWELFVLFSPSGPPLAQFHAGWGAGTKAGPAQLLLLELLAPLGLELWEGFDPSNLGLREMSTISPGNLILGGDSSLASSDGGT